MKKVILSISACIPLIGFQVNADELSPRQTLGKSIFFDENLSINRNQSCAVCHKPETGWTGPIAAINQHGTVYEGSVNGLFGNRKPPSSAYATPSPILHYTIERREAVFTGGNFWDGRATGEKLGNPAADQAQGPFLNPVEQALPDSACVVYRVCNPQQQGQYPVSFQEVWGAEFCEINWPADINEQCQMTDGHVDLSDEDRATADTAYDYIALSIADFEDSPESNQFTSKFDYFLKGKARLTRQERRGLALFRGRALCANCHVLDSMGRNSGRGDSEDNRDDGPLFTDFTFDNLGVPRNPENPWYTMPFNPDGWDWTDKGLGGFLESRMDYQQFAAENYGKHKIPTLRNVDKRPGPGFVKAFSHNGYFKSLKSIVHFYNTRDVKPVCPDPFTTEEEALAMDCWPEPEIPMNVNTKELGNLGLSSEQEDAIVAFMKTLSDGYIVDEDEDENDDGDDADDDDDEH